MQDPIVLASASPIRRQLLDQAGVPVEVIPARVDEEMVKAGLLGAGAPPRDVADKLADLKAQKIAMKHPDRLVLGCDQILECDGKIYSKAADREELATHLRELSGKTHRLLSAAVFYEEARPVWRSVGVARLTMRVLSDSYLESYIERNGEAVLSSVGGYRLEEEGVRLFSRVDGDYFTILGMPLIDILNYLVLRGDLSG